MKAAARACFGAAVTVTAALLGSTSLIQAQAQETKPNILFIMGDDIGWMQPSIYHQGLMVGETPNIDRIGNEGAKFMTYYAEQSCTAGRTAFITGMQPVRVGMVLPEIPGSPSYLRAGTPHLARFLNDLGYSTGEFGKNHLGDTTESLMLPPLSLTPNGSLFAVTSRLRLLNLLDDLLQIVAGRVLHRREVDISLQFLQPERLADRRHISFPSA